LGIVDNHRRSRLGVALRNARKAAGMTQAQLAEASGVTRITVIAAEDGNGSARTFLELVDHLGYELRGSKRLPPGATIGARLLQLRALRGESRAAVSRLADVDTLTVRNVENGNYGHLRVLESIGIAVGAGLRLAPKGQLESPWLGALKSSASVDWNTPSEFLERLYPLVNGRFACDPCSPTPNGPVRALVHFTAEDDGLSLDWPIGAIWVNPPYARGLTGQWTSKCRQEAENGVGPIFGLIPARTDTAWWHDSVAHHAHVAFLRRRLAFGSSDNSAPFPSALAIWGLDEDRLAMLHQALADAWHVPSSSPRRPLQQEAAD
jgi:transcriptional regulator with XRE-family HTH domain